jgi:hypothetical protein
MNRFLYTIITCSALLHLSSCSSGGDQDRAQASQEHKPWNGVAIDGHIARAKIYVDSNNNGTQDPWEPYAFTDDHGYYGYNPNTGTDYCRSDATEHEKTFCLRASVTQGKVTLRITGGYDRLTGEPFIGQLSRRVDATNLSDTQSTVISPITSLVTALDDPATQNALLTSLGLEHKDLNIDYLNAGSSQSVDALLLNTALKIHKTITLLNGPSESHYAALNDEPGIANDATSFLYQALATELSERKIPLDIALRDNELIDAIALNAEATLRDILDKNDLILPRSIEQSDNRDRFEAAKRHTQAIPDVIDRLLNVGDISMDRGQIIGQVRAVEMLIIKALAANPDDASVQNAFQFFLNTDNANHIEALRLALSDDTADISNLAKNNFIDIGAILASAQIQNNTGAFKNITQSKIRVMDMDLGIAPHQLKDIELELYFSASSQPNASATGCLRKIH